MNKNRKYKKLRRLLLVLFFGFFMIILALPWIISMPIVQKYLIQRTRNFVYDRTKAELKVDHFYLDYSSDLSVKNLLLVDVNQDTICNFKDIGVGFEKSLKSVFRRELILDYIKIQGGKFALRKINGQSLSNIGQFLDQLKGIQPTSQGWGQAEIADTVLHQNQDIESRFHIDLDVLELENVYFWHDNEWKGNDENFYVPYARFEVEDIKSDSNLIILEKAEISDVFVDLIQTFPLPRIDQKSSEYLGSPKDGLRVFIKDAVLNNGRVRVDNERSPEQFLLDGKMNYRKMDISQVNLKIEDFLIDDWKFYGSLKKMSAETSTGFKLINATTGPSSVTCNRTELNGLELITENSVLRDTIILKYSGYSDFEDFENKVRMDLRLKDSELYLDDLVHFVPNLYNSPVIRQNIEKKIYYTGSLLGKVSNLRGRNVQMQLEEYLEFVGSFSTRNLTSSGNELFNFEFENLVTTTQNLEKIVPNLSLPSNFRNLGRIQYEGYFDGLILDFVNSGTFTTDLGEIDLDMRLDLKNGKTGANYSGFIRLVDFDVARWADDSSFGKTSLVAEVENGFGLTLESVDATLNSELEYFQYNGHAYRDFEVEGVLRKNLFNGNLEINEDLSDFSFSGVIDFSSDLPKVDFTAEIDHLDLYELNFSKRPLAVNGRVDINLLDLNIDKAVGQIIANDFEAIDSLRKYEFGALKINLAQEEGERIVAAQSDKGKISVIGDFKITELKNSFLYLIQAQYPEYFDLMKLNLEEGYHSDDYFDFTINFEDTESILNLIGAEELRFYNFDVRGKIDNRALSSDLKVNFDSMTMPNVTLSDLQVRQTGGKGSNLLGVYSSVLEIGQLEFRPMEIEAEIRDHQILFSIQTSQNDNQIPEFDLLGTLNVSEAGYSFHFDRVFHEEGKWRIHPDNRLDLFGENLFVKDFSIFNEDLSLRIEENHNQKGIVANLTGIDFSIIDELWNYDKLDFSGATELHVNIPDLQNFKGFDFDINSDSFQVNGDNFGKFNVYGDYSASDHGLNYNLRIHDEKLTLSSLGNFIIPDPLSADPIVYDLNVEFVNFPLRVVEYFIGGISGAKGYLGAKMKIVSEDGKPVPQGTAFVDSGYVFVDYLKTGFFIPNEEISVLDNMFDASGSIITDELGNVGRVTGGVRHSYMNELMLEARVEGEELLVLDSKKGDNNLFFGRAFGSVDAKFEGPVDDISLDVKGESKQGTKLFIPIGSSGDFADGSSFVRFITDEDSVRIINDLNNSSMDVHLDLILNDLAEIEMIFNDQTGEVLRGRGRGNLSIDVTKESGMEMYGDYIVSEGEYLFRRGFISKPFIVDQGGVIRWSGDPLDAQINIIARYESLTSSVSTFLSEFLVNRTDDIVQQAKAATTVDLSMTLMGALLTPTIAFDILFPDLQGELAIMADSKLRTLKNDEQQLNEQVVGLIVFRTFIPSSGAGGGFVSGITNAGFNTLSEFISSQISVLVSKLLGEAVDASTFISGLDFQVGLSNYQNLSDISEEDLLTSSEILLKLRPSFLNDRLLLDAGANIVSNSPVSSGTFVGENVVIEYLLTPDGRFKLRAYQKSVETLEGRRREFGMGFSYRKEFESFKEFFQSSKRAQKSILEIGKDSTKPY